MQDYYEAGIKLTPDGDSDYIWCQHHHRVFDRAVKCAVGIKRLNDDFPDSEMFIAPSDPRLTAYTFTIEDGKVRVNYEFGF